MAQRPRRKVRRAARWRLDQDYWAKLPPAAAAWLAKFLDEYQLATFGADPLHSPEQRREIYRNQNAADRDVVTQTDDKVAEVLKNQSKRRRYGPADYGRPEGPPDDPE